MNGYAFTFAAQPLVALPSGALHWPDHRLLIVSDLHLGKSERMARRGGTLLPPYETRETLTRLSGDLESTGAKSLISLGDSFDDLTAADTLDEGDSMTLNRLMAGRDWIWVMGNHDAGTFALGGTHRADVTIGPIAFRHIATAQTRLRFQAITTPRPALAPPCAAAFWSITTASSSPPTGPTRVGSIATIPP
jgi:uncharacterized protein